MLALKRFLNLRRGRINARKEVRKQLRIRGRLENDVFKKINTLFRTQLRKTSNEFKITDRFDPEIFVRETSAVMEAVMNQHYKKIFRIIYRNNEEQYDRGRKDEEVFVFGRAKDFERLINSYFRTRTPYFSNMSSVMARAIQKQVQQGRANNLNLDQIARNITGLTKLGRGRASVIARTETHNAASFANHEYHKTASSEYGIEMVKRWVATGDARTRSAHAQANGQTVPMDEKFKVGGADMEYAGDPAGGVKNVVNCRCVIVYVEPDDEENIIEDEELIAKNDFGETHPDELAYHLNGDWEGEANVLQSIRNGSALNGVVEKTTRGCFYRPSTREIHMTTKYGKDKTKVVWRHEYGHAVDADTKLHDILLNPDVLDFDAAEILTDSRHISALAYKEILNDRKKLSALNRKQKKIRDTAVLNTEAGSKFKESIYKKFGFKRIDNEYAPVNAKNLEKSIRDYLKTTDGPFNTELLDELIGADWAESLIKDIDPRSPHFWYVNEAIDTITSLKYNYTTKGDSIISKLMIIAKRSKNEIANQELLMFDDFIGSVSNNLYFEGHSTSYYKKFRNVAKGVTVGHTTEAFANYYALLGGKNSAFWRPLLNIYAPETLQRFDQLVQTIGG